MPQAEACATRVARGAPFAKTLGEAGGSKATPLRRPPKKSGRRKAAPTQGDEMQIVNIEAARELQAYVVAEATTHKDA
ncbi:MAG: hypothetical protein ACYDDI_10040 [Candidatus Acidiferrales bacterium]